MIKKQKEDSGKLAGMMYNTNRNSYPSRRIIRKSSQGNFNRDDLLPFLKRTPRHPWRRLEVINERANDLVG